MPSYFIDKQSLYGYTNPFDKGIITNIIEVFVSTFSNSGLSRKASSQEIMDMHDDETNDKASFDRLQDNRILKFPLNWSKTFICGILEVKILILEFLGELSYENRNGKKN